MKAAYRGGVRASTSPAKEGYAVSDANVVKLLQPGSFADPLTEVLRNGARPTGPSDRGRGGGIPGQACRSEDRYWFAPRGSSRAPTRTRGNDRHRPGRRAPASRARPWRCGG